MACHKVQNRNRMVNKNPGIQINCSWDQEREPWRKEQKPIRQLPKLSVTAVTSVPVSSSSARWWKPCYQGSSGKQGSLISTRSRKWALGEKHPCRSLSVVLNEFHELGCLPSSWLVHPVLLSLSTIYKGKKQRVITEALSGFNLLHTHIDRGPVLSGRCVVNEVSFAWIGYFK